MTEELSDADPSALTLAIEAARSGLRRDVQKVVDELDEGRLLVALKQSMEAVELGTDVAVDGDFSISPHLLLNQDDELYAAFFSEAETLEPVADELGWQTDGGELEVCALPARLALEVALEILQEDAVDGVVLNAGSQAELVLRRDEVASIAAGTALPLVGYVSSIPEDDEEPTLVADGEPPPPALIKALERCVTLSPLVTGFEVLRTFNPDRDREPHLTVRLSVAGDVDRDAIAREVVERIQHAVPPPGYLDIIFKTT